MRKLQRYCSLNTDLTNVNTESRERSGESANKIVANPNATAFFKINASSVTLANNFPVEPGPGCLIVFNLYGQHIIQVFFSMDLRIFVRSHANINDPSAGMSWRAWREI